MQIFTFNISFLPVFTFPNLLGRQLPVFAASAPAQSPGDLETAPFQYLAQCAEHAGRLAEPHAERIDRIARGDQHGPLALVQRNRHAVLPLAHHRIDHPVEQHLQRPAHVAPIAGRPDDQGRRPHESPPPRGGRRPPAARNAPANGISYTRCRAGPACRGRTASRLRTLRAERRPHGRASAKPARRGGDFRL